MKKSVTYLLLPNGEKLISWYIHDYKTKEINGEFYMIDGGQGNYIRYSNESGKAKLINKPVEEVFHWIREEFTWTSHYDVNKKLLKNSIERLLKELDKEHLETLIKEKQGTELMRKLFNLELAYRNKIKNEIKVRKLNT